MPPNHLVLSNRVTTVNRKFVRLCLSYVRFFKTHSVSLSICLSHTSIVLLNSFIYLHNYSPNPTSTVTTSTPRSTFYLEQGDANPNLRLQCGNCKNSIHGSFFLTSCVKDCTLCTQCTNEHFKHNEHCPSCLSKLESDADIIGIPGVNELHERFAERKNQVDNIGSFSSNLIRVPEDQRKNDAFNGKVAYLYLQECVGKDRLAAMIVAGGGQVTTDITQHGINLFVCSHHTRIPDAAKECQGRGGNVVGVDWVIYCDWRDTFLPIDLFGACEDEDAMNQQIMKVEQYLVNSAPNALDILKVCRPHLTGNEFVRLEERLDYSKDNDNN